MRFLALYVLLALGAAILPAAAQNPLAPATPAAEPVPALTAEQAARALIEVLDDEAARSRLIGELGRIAADAPAAGTSPPASAAPTVGKPEESQPESTLSRELGLVAGSIAKDFTEIVKRIWIRLSHVASVLTGSAQVNWPVAQQHLQALVLVGGLAFAVLWLARFGVRWPLRHLSAMATGRSPTIKVMLNVIVVLIELGCVALATAASMLAIAGLDATTVRSDVVEGSFANTFALVETIKIAIRMVFSPQRPNLRLLPFTDAAARYWSFWLARFTGLLGYGVLIFVPIVTAAVSFAVALGVRMLIAIVALVGFVALVLANRASVRAGMIQTVSRSRSVTVTTTLTLLAPVWHVIAIGYAALAFAVWITRPLDAIGYMVSATAQSLVTLAVGGGLMALISRGIEGGVRLPTDMREALPLLETRLNVLVPTLLRILRILMAVVLIGGILQAWQFIDVFDWARSDSGAALLRRVVAASVILLISMAIWIAATSWIEYRLRPMPGRVSTPRMRTLMSLFRNAFSILITVIAVMLALSELGVDIAPLIAGAGVLGLAVGFGSQKLVQDIITGAFIQFENAMNEGDVVTVAGISGSVEKLSIRSVGLRDVNGVYHVIPFSSVDLVSNSMRGFAFHVADLKVSIEEDIGEVKRLMQEAFDRLMRTNHQSEILEPLEMNGIISFADSAVVVRARIKTLPGKQWGIGRSYNELVKSVFDAAGIPIPAPPPGVFVRDYNPGAKSPGEGEHKAVAGKP
jgi:small-conductance mechanosensitive channel